MSQQNNREKGDALETFVSNKLNIPKTTNSGAKFKNGDLANREFIVECKSRDKDTLSINKKDLLKLKSQALDTGKEWIYVQENNLGRFALIDFEFLVQMFELIRELRLEGEEQI